MEREERVSHSSDQSCSQQGRCWNQMPQAQRLCSSCNRLSKLPHLSVFLCLHVRGFPGGSEAKNPPANAGDAGDTGSINTGWEDPLEKQTATLSGILAWNIPWTEEPAGATVSGVLMYIILWEFHIHT